MDVEGAADAILALSRGGASQCSSHPTLQAHATTAIPIERSSQTPHPELRHLPEPLPPTSSSSSPSSSTGTTAKVRSIHQLLCEQSSPTSTPTHSHNWHHSHPPHTNHPVLTTQRSSATHTHRPAPASLPQHLPPLATVSEPQPLSPVTPALQSLPANDTTQVPPVSITSALMPIAARAPVTSALLLRPTMTHAYHEQSPKSAAYPHVHAQAQSRPPEPVPECSVRSASSSATASASTCSAGAVRYVPPPALHNTPLASYAAPSVTRTVAAPAEPTASATLNRPTASATLTEPPPPRPLPKRRASAPLLATNPACTRPTAAATPPTAPPDLLRASSRGVSKKAVPPKRRRKSTTSIHSTSTTPSTTPVTIPKKHYANPAPSGHCHCCARTSRAVSFVVCSRLHAGLCRKVICNKCFARFGWDWDAAQADTTWTCTHCRGVCPEGASQCYIYERVNRRRMKKSTAASTAARTLKDKVAFKQTIPKQKPTTTTLTQTSDENRPAAEQIPDTRYVQHPTRVSQCGRTVGSTKPT